MIGEGGKAALFGECKWSSKPVGTDVLDEVKAKAQFLAREAGFEKLAYTLFSRSGFTPR